MIISDAMLGPTTTNANGGDETRSLSGHLALRAEPVVRPASPCGLPVYVCLHAGSEQDNEYSRLERNGSGPRPHAERHLSAPARAIRRAARGCEQPHRGCGGEIG